MAESNPNTAENILKRLLKESKQEGRKLVAEKTFAAETVGVRGSRGQFQQIVKTISEGDENVATGYKKQMIVSVKSIEAENLPGNVFRDGVKQIISDIMKVVNADVLLAPEAKSDVQDVANQLMRYADSRGKVGARAAATAAGLAKRVRSSLADSLSGKRSILLRGLGYLLEAPDRKEARAKTIADARLDATQGALDNRAEGNYDPELMRSAASRIRAGAGPASPEGKVPIDNREQGEYDPQLPRRRRRVGTSDAGPTSPEGKVPIDNREQGDYDPELMRSGASRIRRGAGPTSPEGKVPIDNRAQGKYDPELMSSGAGSASPEVKVLIDIRTGINKLVASSVGAEKSRENEYQSDREDASLKAEEGQDLYSPTRLLTGKSANGPDTGANLWEQVKTGILGASLVKLVPTIITALGGPVRIFGAIAAGFAAYGLFKWLRNDPRDINGNPLTTEEKLRTGATVGTLAMGGVSGVTGAVSKGADAAEFAAMDSATNPKRVGVASESVAGKVAGALGPGSKVSKVLGTVSKYAKIGGRIFTGAGIALDAYDASTATDPTRRKLKLAAAGMGAAGLASDLTVAGAAWGVPLQIGAGLTSLYADLVYPDEPKDEQTPAEESTSPTRTSTAAINPSKTTFADLTTEQQDAFFAAQTKQEGFKPGSLSYDLNNPGNMLYSPWQKKYGGELDTTGRGVGKVKGLFAKFPTLQNGVEAQKALWMTPKFSNLPLDKALNLWTTGNKNSNFDSTKANNTNYKNAIYAAIGSPQTTLASASPSKSSSGQSAAISLDTSTPTATSTESLEFDNFLALRRERVAAKQSAATSTGLPSSGQHTATPVTTSTPTATRSAAPLAGASASLAGLQSSMTNFFMNTFQNSPAAAQTQITHVPYYSVRPRNDTQYT